MNGVLLALLVYSGLVAAAGSEACTDAAIDSFVSRMALPSNSTAALEALLHAHTNMLEFDSCNKKSNDSTSSSKHSRAALACSIGNIVFDGGIISPSSSSYEEEVEMSWSQTCWLMPSCIFLPTGATDVATALEIVTLTNSVFAVRSGGHNANRGFSNVDSEGILIDLAGLTDLSLSGDHKSLITGPGNRWEQVYKSLSDTNVTVLGGRVPGVGVGGLLLGGGLSWHSGTYGLACDNVKSFEIVLSNSSIVKASADTNADLFWALKGGGANFGIVTKFELNTVPIGQLWYQSLVYDVSKAEQVLDAIYDFEIASQSDTKGAIAASFSRSSVFVGLIYGAPVEKPEVFDSFFTIPIANTSTAAAIGTPYDVIQTYGDTLSTSAARWDIQAISTQVDSSVSKEAYTEWAKIAQSVHESFGAEMTFSLQPITKETVLQGYQNGGNPLGLQAVAQDWYTGTISWTDPSRDAEAHAAVSAYGKAVQTAASAKQKLLRTRYMNDASFDQDPLKQYGEVNVARLRAVSRKYDGRQVFQRLQNNGFLLSNIL